MTTLKTRQEAETIARLLLQDKMIACANILDALESLYLWNGTVEKSTEALLMCKTTAKLLYKVIELIESEHPYDCPVIETLRIETLNPKADLWLKGCLKGSLN